MNELDTSGKIAAIALQTNEADLIEVLATSLYPGASVNSIKMVLGYCKATGLDPMQKPVHIVPMWDSKVKMMRDVVMPGIGLYRTQAARNGCAGVSEPDFGPDITEEIGGLKITYPEWCKVTVKRRMSSGDTAEFTAKEFWKENYAVKGGQEKSVAPNAMWAKRPYGQLAKCAEAQALRKAFPELGSEPTADEMEGKILHETSSSLVEISDIVTYESFEADHMQSMVDAARHGIKALQNAFKELPGGKAKLEFWTKHSDSLKDIATNGR